jgi:hypothetical protein
VYNKTRDDFDRVVFFEVGGETWSPDATYRVVTSDFLAKGNADLKMLPDVPEELITYTGKTMRQALEAWVSRHSPATPGVDGRWLRDDTATPDPAFAAAKAAAAPTP